jgi:hypothetical protein
MSTYLEICQDVARESGTVPSASDGSQPTTVSSQVGTLARIVGWVERSHKEVQLHRADWRWLRARFSSATVATQAVYSATDLGITERFSNWVNPGEYPESQERQFTLYQTSKGQADQGFMRFYQWDKFYADTQVGANAAQTGKPLIASIDPNDNIHVWPTPDATGYTMGGPYHKSPQTLSADSDTPEMPAEHHDAIMFGALVKLGIFDEAPADQVNYWAGKYKRHITDLEAKHIPMLRSSDPLA